MTLLTRKQARSVDRFAIEHIGIPGIVLMENAGRNTAAVIRDILRRTGPSKTASHHAIILCGGGNNGGDGYVIARHLHNAGTAVTVLAVVDPARLTGDAAINHRICGNLGLDIRSITDAASLDAESSRWSDCVVIVDALLGTGFQGQVRPHMAAVIDRVNAVEGPLVVAVDVPSGLDCDTGQPTGAAIRADVTVTFIASKTGFQTPQAAAHVGRLVVADIGIPASAIALALSHRADSPGHGTQLRE